MRTVVEVLRITRVATAYGVVANAMFVVLWVRRHPEHEPAGVVAELPLALALFGAAVVSVALYAFGTALNDVFDANRDRALRLDRPIATGGLSPGEESYGRAYLTNSPLEARDHLQRAVDQDASVHGAWQHLAFLQLLLGEVERARLVVEGYRALFPENPGAPFLEVLLLAFGGDTRAVAAKVKAARKQPQGLPGAAGG